ncbi:YibE/F family protein [Aquibacillus koreensis]|uniref:YibE/F family protein n=1 Tax=Aquibacillus koreensis TaxID=279446 RepID=A0A9X4AJ91_9BACI|nr:YibE/F family protein [Aquibacillus koreensis]MCT2536881.1 YibE/F family protein [Aquibacillus koreensis]MDC3421987.1 YibE/F family protein [Aquibacillus koreensis]
MNTIVALALILLILMVLVGGRKGAKSFIAIFLNFAVLIVTIFIMLDPSADPIILTIFASTLISCITLFYINDVNSTTKTAFLSTVITIVILLALITFLTETTMIQGFSEEEIGELYIFSFYIGIDFVKIVAAMIIMSTIGAITDMAIAIASPMREIHYHHPTISRKELYRSGVSIGRDILGTNTNTLFFAFFGGYLALLIWFKDLSYTFGEIINSKVFSEEMITIMCAGIGIAIIIPITSGITAYALVRSGDN